MKSFGKTLITLAVIMMGCMYGYINAPNQTVTANEVTRIRWVDVPKENNLLTGAINIDLQDGKVGIDGNVSNTTVTVQTEIKEVPVYKTRTKTVEKIIYEPNLTLSTKLLKKIAPLELPKINADRN